MGETDTSILTRRGLVTGAVASAAALAANALRPAGVLGATGDPMIAGGDNKADITTKLTCSGAAFTGLRVDAKSVAVWGEIAGAGSASVAMLGATVNSTGNSTGVQAVSDANDGNGVWAQSANIGVRAEGSRVGVLASGLTALRGLGGFRGVEGFSGSESGAGVYGKVTHDGSQTIGVFAEATGKDNVAVRGDASHPTARGVVGRNTAGDSTGDGVYGESRGDTAIGVHGLGGGVGVVGDSDGSAGTGVQGNGMLGVLGVARLATGAGVRGDGGDTGANGVEGLTAGATHAGVFGSNTGGGDGILGTADGDDAAGVHGVNGAGAGVRGVTGLGAGVSGVASSGIGVRGIAGTGGTAGSFEATSGRALFANGPVQLDLASGLAGIRAGLKFVDVAVGFPISISSKVLATLNSSAGGKTSIALAEVLPGNIIRIQLTEKATVDCRVAWLVLW